MGNIIKMKWKMIEVLTNPNKFFETRIKGEESLMIPVLIVLINGIISGGTVAFLIVSVSRQILPPEVHPEVHSLALKFGINSFIFMTFLLSSPGSSLPLYSSVYRGYTKAKGVSCEHSNLSGTVCTVSSPRYWED